MLQLPQSHNLPVKFLAACFNNTVATYKFYWFLGILQAVEEGKHEIQKTELFARMLSNPWFTVNYFKISFGKSDLIQEAIRQIREIENISIDENPDLITQKLIHSPNKLTNTILWHFNRNVPHWFLSPWYRGFGKSQIYEYSQKFERQPLYALYTTKIIINPEWYEYLFNNTGVFKDFCLWNLAIFLQAKNPNVPDIPNKLIKLASRNSLSQQRIKFWNIVISELGSVECIYTGEKLTIDKYDVEHFIPYSFVSHDLIWNLLPSEQSFNRVKSNKLPPPERYFDPFYDMQKKAVDIIISKNPNNRFLEDYLTIFPDIREMSKDRFRERVLPLITIASNNGFEFMQ